MRDASREAEIRARVNAATEGPWTAQTFDGRFLVLDDVVFAAHAREDIPYLLAELVVLRERATEAERQRDGFAAEAVNRAQTELELRERANTYEETLRGLHEAANLIDVALAEVDSTAMQIADHPDGDEWVGSYFLRCGPWHRVLGRRSQLSYALAKAKRALAPSVDRQEPGT